MRVRLELVQAYQSLVRGGNTDQGMHHILLNHFPLNVCLLHTCHHTVQHLELYISRCTRCQEVQLNRHSAPVILKHALVQTDV
jgi:hypothetical protein